ncbi:MAG TPA: ATP synthase F1 subunit epsilon [Xanthomonadaceae bacterium]|nr:ATP synthase F1 subunit epsilon [Xanthomonadaceae bacterium]
MAEQTLQTLPAAVAATAASLELSVVSLTDELWSGDVREVSLPGAAGRFGVMARHLPLLATLREGMVHIHPAQGASLQIYISGGYAEVQPDRVTVLADLATRSEDLDQARAQAAREAARSPMAESFTEAAYAQLHMELMHRYSANLRHPLMK